MPPPSGGRSLTALRSPCQRQVPSPLNEQLGKALAASGHSGLTHTLIDVKKKMVSFPFLFCGADRRYAIALGHIEVLVENYKVMTINQ